MMLADLAKKAVAETPDTREACAAVRKALTPEMREACAEELLTVAIRTAVENARYASRQPFKAATVDKPLERMRIVASAVGPVAKRLLEDWKVGNKCLGDCDSGDLGVAIASGQRSSDGILKNNRFYAALQAKLQPGQRVRDVVTNESGMEILERVRGGAGMALAV